MGLFKRSTSTEDFLNDLPDGWRGQLASYDRIDERARWQVKLESMIYEPREDARDFKWMMRNRSALDSSFEFALGEASKILLAGSDIESTMAMLRLSALLDELLSDPGGAPWAANVIGVLKMLEEDGVGPRSSNETRPSDAVRRACNFRGCRLAEGQEHQAALAHFNFALQQDPMFAPAYCNRARVWVELNDLEQAETDCQTLATIDPDYPEARRTAELVDRLRASARSGGGTAVEAAEKEGLLATLRSYDRPRLG